MGEVILMFFIETVINHPELHFEEGAYHGGLSDDTWGRGITFFRCS